MVREENGERSVSAALVQRPGSGGVLTVRQVSRGVLTRCVGVCLRGGLCVGLLAVLTRCVLAC